MSEYDLLVAGEINPDLILSGDVEPVFDQVEKLLESATLTIGSSSAILACGAVRLGLKVAFIGVCGDDLFGHFMLNAMQAQGVDVSQVVIDPRQITGVSVILNRGMDRAILTHTGAMATLRAEQISDNLLRQARHLHVASYYLQIALQPDMPGLFRRARELGLSTSLDTNWDPTEHWSGLDDLLPLTNVFLPNQAEACAIAGVSDIESAGIHLACLAEIVAVKLGASGAAAWQGSDTYKSTSIPVKVVDTIGAGDTFDAGFLYGYLNGWPVNCSLQLACVCGALSTQSAGGTAGQPTLDEAIQYVSG